MKLFKNSVGRPSNEVLKKRKVFIAVIVTLGVALIGGGTFFGIKYFSNSGIKSFDKNASVTLSKKVRIERKGTRVTSYRCTRDEGNIYKKNSGYRCGNGTAAETTVFPYELQYNGTMCGVVSNGNVESATAMAISAVSANYYKIADVRKYLKTISTSKICTDRKLNLQAVKQAGIHFSGQGFVMIDTKTSFKNNASKINNAMENYFCSGVVIINYEKCRKNSELKNAGLCYQGNNLAAFIPSNYKGYVIVNLTNTSTNKKVAVNIQNLINGSKNGRVYLTCNKSHTLGPKG